MILNSPYISGSLTVTGNEVVTGSLTVLGGITGAITGSATSASFATNTSLLNNKNSAEFVSTGSFNSYTSSNDATVTNVAAAAVSAVAGVNALAARTGSYTLTSSFNSYTASNNATMSCVSATATAAIAGVGSLAAQTGSYATTGSNTFIGNQTITGSIFGSGSLTINGCITSTGQIVAQTINVQQVTSSIVYSCGSNTFGTAIGNTQTMTGSVFITGSLTVTTTAPELTVGATGVTLGNLISDTHNVTGSLRITGSVVSVGAACFSSCVTAGGGVRTTGANGFSDTDGTSTIWMSSNWTSSRPAIAVTTNHPLMFLTNNTERVRIANTGEACFACQVCAPVLLASSYFVSSPNTTVSGQGPLDWVYLGAADSAASRATAVQIGDVSGAKYAILGGSFDLTFVKHVCNTNTWTPAFVIQGNSFNNNIPDVTFNNNVGVGISLPGARLDVLSTLNVQATGNSDVPYINFSNNGRSFDWGRVGGLLQGDGDGALYFSTKLGGGVTEKLRITSTGIACFACQVCAPSFQAGSSISIDRPNPPVSFAIGQAFGNTYSIHRGTASLTSTSCTTLFTVCVPLHHSANVEVHAFEDWGGHSSIYYTGKWVISNSETFYNAPGGFQVYAPVNNSYNGDCFMANWGLNACNSSPAGAFLFRMRTNSGSTTVRFVTTIMGNTVWIG